MSLGNEGFASTKKIWGIEDTKHTAIDAAKGLLVSDSHQWGRDSTWSSGPSSNVGGSTSENGVLSEHAVSQPIMVKRGTGSAYSNDGTLLSPRSTDTGGIGMKMAEYVLNNSPSKDNLDSRLHSRILSSEHEKENNTRKNYYKDVIRGHHSNTNGLTNGFSGAGSAVPEDVNTIDSSKLFNRAPGLAHQLSSDDNDELAKNNNIINKMDGIMPPINLNHHQQQPFTDFNPEQIHSVDPLHSFGDYATLLSTDFETGYPNTLYQQRTNTGQNNNPMSILSKHTQQHLSLTAAAAAQHQQNQGIPSGSSVGHPGTTTGPSGSTNVFQAPPGQNPQGAYFSDPYSMSHMLASAQGTLSMSQYHYSWPWNIYPNMINAPSTTNGQIQSQSTGHHSSIQQQSRTGGPSNANRPLSPSTLQQANQVTDASNQTNSQQAFAALQAAASQQGLPLPLPYNTSNFFDPMVASRGMSATALHPMMPQMPLTGNSNIHPRIIPNPSNQNPTQSANNPLFTSNGPANNPNANQLYTSVQNSVNLNPYSNIQSNNMFNNAHTSNQPQIGPQQIEFPNPGIK